MFRACTHFPAFPRQVWARNFDGLIGPFEQKYDDLKTTIGGLYEVAKGKHALGLVNLVRPWSQMANISHQRSSSETIFHVGVASHVHAYLFFHELQIENFDYHPEFKRWNDTFTSNPFKPK